jgi:hypothetical protein
MRIKSPPSIGMHMSQFKSVGLLFENPGSLLIRLQKQPVWIVFRESVDWG